MNNVLSTIAFLFLSIVYCQAQETANLTVTIPNAQIDQGTMQFSLNTQDTFMSIPFKVETTTIKDGIATIVFKDVPVGEYAVLVAHDKNDNGKLDMQVNGMPLEPYGVSNNKMSFGPPTWNDARFTLDKDLTITIRL